MPTALFPAASRMKRGGSLMSPMFHNSFHDVHLLFEVRIRKLESDSQKWPLLIPLYSPDHAVRCTLPGQRWVFCGRRWAGLTPQSERLEIHLWEDHPEETSRDITTHFQPFQFNGSPPSGRFRAHPVDAGVHRPAGGQLHQWTPAWYVERVVCKFVQSYQTRSDPNVLNGYTWYTLVQLFFFFSCTMRKHYWNNNKKREREKSKFKDIKKEFLPLQAKRKGSCCVIGMNIAPWHKKVNCRDLGWYSSKIIVFFTFIIVYKC